MITNRKYMINQLRNEDFLDDSGASYEAMVYYRIACPYFNGDDRCHCNGKKLEEITRELCYQCKECKKRHYNCHANCKAYLKAKAKREQTNIKKRMGNTADGLSGRIIGMRWWS